LWLFNIIPAIGRINVFNWYYEWVDDRYVVTCTLEEMARCKSNWRCVSLARLSEPPQMTTEPRNLTVFEGDSVTLHCMAFSSEPCITHWLQHHRVNGSYFDRHNTLNFFTQIRVCACVIRKA